MQDPMEPAPPMQRIRRRFLGWLAGLWAAAALFLLAMGWWQEQGRWWQPLATPMPRVDLGAWRLPAWQPPAEEPEPATAAEAAAAPITNTGKDAAPPAPAPQWVTYETQAGDTLNALAARFDVRVEDIQGAEGASPNALLAPGQTLRIPFTPRTTTPAERLFPDSEVVASPSSVGFDIQAFVNQAGGYLQGYTQYLPSPGTLKGWQVVRYAARNYAINPRLLLALLEFQGGWVSGIPDEARQTYPLGYTRLPEGDLYRQLRAAAEDLSYGYYGWREGRLTRLRFPDGQELYLAPTLNAGTVALMYYFSRHYPLDQWQRVLDPEAEDGFLAFYARWFGDPWERAAKVEPLYPPDLRQPEMILPFSRGARWYLTSGPHGGYGEKGAWAALDFAPLGSPGCYTSPAWVLAAASGLVVRSEKGIVVVDLDADGHEETGWVLFYLHVATQDRVPAGTFVNRGDLIGHPSCEGGRATGTHVHIARRFNGEWMAAGGPVPFNLGGWIAYSTGAYRRGYLERDGQRVIASMYGGAKAQIIRRENDP